ncbi:Uncharacterised protein [uncultured archaeon]|nr:Uncharacterised protein [uncultured archaeon]
MKKDSMWIMSALTVFVLFISLSFPVVATTGVGKDSTAKASRTLDDKFEEVAGKVPEFGGMFLEGDELNVYLVNPEKKSAAEEGVISVFGRERVPRGGIKVLQGQYTFTKLKEWQKQMGGLFKIHGVVFTDVDERSNRLKIGVESSNLAGVVETELKKQGIPSGAYIIEQTEPIVFASTLQDMIRPLQGGIQIRFSNYLCTLGFNGVRSGINGFVIPSHCTDIQGGVESTKYYQPLDATNSYFIGTEIADPLYFSGVGCYTGYVCRYSDSAFAARDPGVTADLGFIKKPDSVNTGSLTIAGSFRIVKENSSFAGETLNKVGRTTGWTQGQVTNTCVDTGVSGTNIVQLCQNFVSASVGAGDSGSPVFNIINGNDVELQGILWGSSGGTSFVYSPIANIEYELGSINTTITDTTPPGQVSGVTVSSVSYNMLGLSWTANTEPDISYYNIYRSTSSGFVPASANRIATSTVNSFNDNGVAPSTTYYYVVSAVDTSGNEGIPSSEVTGTTTTAPLKTMHVSSISMSKTTSRTNGVRVTYATATVTVVDASNKPISGAVVSGQWSGLTNEAKSGTTDTYGRARIRSSSVKNAAGTFTFTVNGITKVGWTYDPVANVITSKSITI